jgi:hypothetical protein
MGMRENPFDISGELDIKSQKAVSREVACTFTSVYDRDAIPQLDQPLADFSSLFFWRKPVLSPV